MRKIIAISLGAFIFIGIVFILAVLGNIKKTPTSGQNVIPTPVSQNPGSKKPPSLHYEKTATDKLLLVATTRPTPIVESDSTIRNQLVAALDGGSGTISETANYKLEYVKAPNDFEAQIKGADVSLVKQQVVSYLASRGLTNDGICKLPLVFFLNYQTLNSYRSSGQTFSPIPDFCK